MTGRRFRRLFRLPLFRSPAEDVDEEIRFHLETRAEEFMRRGYGRAEAIAEARRRFGIRSPEDLELIRRGLQHSAERREVEMRLRDRLDSVRQDIHYALRSIRARPAFTAAVVLTLALGIGATTAIYSVVQAVLLEPLPYTRPDRTVMVWNHWTNWPRTWLSEPEAYDYAQQRDVFESFAPFTSGSLSLTSGAGDPERLNVGAVAPALFDVTGTRALAGRVFLASEGQPNAPRVVLITQALLERRFGGDRSIVGRTIDLDGEAYEVVGVLPASFRLPLEFAGEHAQAFVPLTLGPPKEDDRANHGLNAVARLRAGVTIVQAQRRMTEYIERFKRDHENVYGPDFGITLVSLSDQVRGDVRPILLVLLLAVSFVLLIACANVANLVLSRAEARQREIAVRMALGAGRGRIVAQLLTENLVLATLGGVLGLSLAAWLARLLSTANLANLPRVDAISINGGVLAFAAGVSIVTGLLCGLAPVSHSVRGHTSNLLRQGRGTSASRATIRVRSMLVAAEVMLAVVATTGALLMARSFARLISVSPGFVADNVLTFRLSAPTTRYRSTTRVRAFYATLLDRVRALPGVKDAGGILALPLATQLGDWGVVIEGVEPPPPGAPGPAIDWQTATPGYIEAMNIPVLRGRAIVASDRRDGQPVVVINAAAEKTYFGGRALGRRLRLGGIADTVFRTIVGITGDVRHAGLDRPARPQMYIPFDQLLWNVPDSNGTGPRSLTIVVRTTGDPAAMTTAVRRAVRDLDPALPLAQVRTLDQVFARSVSTPRIAALLLGAFAGLALVLSAIGVYGVTAYSVARRTNEIGIRVALGARVRDVILLIVWQGMRPAVLGLIVGVGAALAGTRLMQKLLYDVKPGDPVSLIAAAAVLLFVAIAANWLPARRAASVDPVTALRAE